MPMHLSRSVQHKRGGSKRNVAFIVCVIIGFCLVLAGLIAIGSSAPGDFPSNEAVIIPPGATLDQAAGLLYGHGFIRSTLLYKAYTALLGGSKDIKSGNYLFTGPQSALRVAYRTIMGDTGFTPIRVFIP